MKISVAMATYNGEKYLQQQLDSLVQQTRPPDELVISDDGSADGTLGIAEKFQAVAPFDVRVFRDQVNLGYTGNFSRALEATTGDLVFLADQDDVWFPQKLKRLGQFAWDNPDAQVVMCDAALTDDDLNPVGVTKLGQIRSGKLPETLFIMGCCAAIRRKFLNLILPIPIGFPAHDLWLVRIADGIKGKVVVEEPLQYYRRHGRNSSNFVANETYPITPQTVFWSKVSKSLRSRGQRFMPALVQERMLREGLERAMSAAEGDIAQKFLKLHQEIDQRIDFLEARSKLHQAAFFQRLLGGMSLWRQGRYKNASGYKSALRDIFIP